MLHHSVVFRHNNEFGLNAALTSLSFNCHLVSFRSECYTSISPETFWKQNWIIQGFLLFVVFKKGMTQCDPGLPR